MSVRMVYRVSVKVCECIYYMKSKHFIHVSRPAGDPPQAAAWLGQCGIYLLIMVLEKGVISLVLLVPGWSKVRRYYSYLCCVRVSWERWSSVRVSYSCSGVNTLNVSVLGDLWIRAGWRNHLTRLHEQCFSHFYSSFVPHELPWQDKSDLIECF